MREKKDSLSLCQPGGALDVGGVEVGGRAQLFCVGVEATPGVLCERMRS